MPATKNTGQRSEEADVQGGLTLPVLVSGWQVGEMTDPSAQHPSPVPATGYLPLGDGVYLSVHVVVRSSCHL